MSNWALPRSPAMANPGQASRTPSSTPRRPRLRFPIVDSPHGDRPRSPAIKDRPSPPGGQTALGRLHGPAPTYEVQPLLAGGGVPLQAALFGYDRCTIFHNRGGLQAAVS